VLPKDQLLVMNAKEGWKPLCAFLKVAEPEEPYPRVNETAQFKARVTQLQEQATRRVGIFFGGVTLFGWVAWKLAASKL